MASDDPPANFLTLAPELRQNILIQTYDVTTTPWASSKHKTDIEQWTATLTEIHADISPDVQYVKTKWLHDLQAQQKAIEQCAEQKWLDRRWTKEGRVRVWKLTREGTAPWTHVYRKLYPMNRKWWHESKAHKIWEAKYHEILESDECPRDHRGKSDWAACRKLADAQVSPPWDNDARRRDIYKKQAYDWQGGPSGILWDRSGCDHPPSTWDRLKAAAKDDIAWLEQHSKNF